jgi:hypothetical protein
MVREETRIKSVHSILRDQQSFYSNMFKNGVPVLDFV